MEYNQFIGGGKVVIYTNYIINFFCILFPRTQQPPSFTGPRRHLDSLFQSTILILIRKKTQPRPPHCLLATQAEQTAQSPAVVVTVSPSSPVLLVSGLLAGGKEGAGVHPLVDLLFC
jgi:hypothetical protein